MAALLAPRQLGFGIPLGAEAAVHAASLYLRHMSERHLLLKLDFKNAFNSLRRDTMLLAVKDRAPELYPLIHSAYGTPLSLFIGDKIIQSAEGVQQGDPLLFCFTTMHLLKGLESELRIFYLDDGTLGGKVEDVLQDLQRVTEEAAELGLQLNHAKSEIINWDQSAISAMLKTAPDLCPIDPEHATLLGSPIGGAEAIDSSIHEKIKALETMGNTLCHLHAHDAYCLLRHSFALPKLLYTLRTSPFFKSHLLRDFDSLLSTLLGKIANICIYNDDLAWAQASPP